MISAAPTNTEAIPLSPVVTCIAVLPQEVSNQANHGSAAANPGQAGGPSRASTGARVTVEFTAQTLIPANCEVAVAYDLADNGRWRECRGIPNFTHSTSHRGGKGATYHYRLSQWIVAGQVMDFSRVDSRHPAA